MAKTPYRTRHLVAGHDVADFRSGNDELDEWLNRYAQRADRAGNTRVYVWVDSADRIVAYYALAPHDVRKRDALRRIARGAPDRIPAILITRLALSETLHGRGYGGALLSDAMRVALRAIRIAGGAVIVVDAIDGNAAGFYAHFGFLSSDQDPHRLMIKARQAATTLGLDWP